MSSPADENGATQPVLPYGLPFRVPTRGLGKVGFCLSLVPWASILLTMVLRPG
jgi:hypothetical protein